MWGTAFLSMVSIQGLGDSATPKSFAEKMDSLGKSTMQPEKGVQSTFQHALVAFEKNKHPLR